MKNKFGEISNNCWIKKISLFLRCLFYKKEITKGTKKRKKVVQRTLIQINRHFYILYQVDYNNRKGNIEKWQRTQQGAFTATHFFVQRQKIIILMERGEKMTAMALWNVLAKNVWDLFLLHICLIFKIISRRYELRRKWLDEIRQRTTDGDRLL